MSFIPDERCLAFFFRPAENDAALAGRYLNVIDEGAGIAVVVTQYVAQLSTLVTADVEGAMVVIDAGVNGLERSIDGIALLVTANDVVAHAQGKGLLVVENVFNKMHTGSVPVCTCSWCLCPFLFECNFLRINNL